MDKEPKSILPEKLITYYDIIKGLGEITLGSIKKLLTHITTEPEPYLSDHYRGASQQLDEHLYDDWYRQDLQADIDRQLLQARNRWDSEGRYFEDNSN